jgi:hypothetical protein
VLQLALVVPTGRQRHPMATMLTYKPYPANCKSKGHNSEQSKGFHMRNQSINRYLGRTSAARPVTVVNG